MSRLLIFLSCFQLCRVFAQSIDITPYSQNRALQDTIAVPLDEADFIPASGDMISETYQIPGYDLYYHYWDVENLRSRQLAIPFVNERLMLLLVQAANHPFRMPCVFDEVMLPYGLTKHGDFHTGIDLKVESQTLVKSCFDGVIRMAKYYGQYGKMVVVRHYNGLETVYAHLDKICVRPGEKLNAGDVIGQAGQTGNASCPVLHFEVRFMNEYFNPELIIDFTNESLIKNTLVLKPSDFTITPLENTNEIPTKSDKLIPPVPQHPPTQTVAPSSSDTAKSQTARSNVFSVTPSINQTDSVKPEYHIVKSGETLYRISINYHISIDKLKEINHIQNGDRIQAGQKLRIK